jgi:carbonic anhydrase
MDNQVEGRGRENRLERGVQRFKERGYRGNRRFFEELEEGQRPHTLFITCSDSRVDPTLLTDSKPGELFIVRNIANIVPPYRRTEEYVSTTAAIEYALLALKVSSIVVCGHSNCGGCAALLGDPEALAAMPHTERWLELARENGFPPSGMAASALERENVVRQANRLLTYPTVRERVAEGSLAIHVWHYAIGRGAVRRWEAEDGAFRPLPAIARSTRRTRPKRSS